MNEIFKQGEDQIINVEITDTPAVDFTIATSIIVSLKVKKETQYKYSLNTKAGYGILQLVSGQANQLNVFVERVESSNFKEGALTAYITASFPNTTFPDGNEVKAWSMNIGRVRAGDDLDETL